ncbi:sodium/hydrogen exchanger 9B2 [Anoplophora glabripennis]|uniref:sodium/hydrogen exchanger 9B2 n=1 Tax=Anoplophora glabripennis TaxID=217634 RepID=UPI000873AF2E|nr:sodium/hydrogen exchanger 9B2 [Anoplophora glabripennis]XP_018579863.1 sodium/hydrogen exchanger 9B2 [Anoplophora glabripennis]XP_018579864.1 sodium/hydrogen exchanger 9B2 [Anoplophora glabripennis]
MSGNLDNADSVTENKKSRKFGMMEGLHGHDNLIFDTSKTRKVSTASTHIEVGPVRKKSVMHKDLENAASIANGDLKHNGDSQRCSQSDSAYSKIQYTKDDGRSWLYLFCMKCRSRDEEKEPWQPSFWPKLCPHPYFPSYRQFTRILSLSLIGIYSWCIMYAIIGDAAAPPHGKLYQLILLSISSHIGGWLMSLTTLPALIGMIFTGLIFQNLNVVDIDDSFTPITKQVSHMALVIILLRAGLDLDPSALKRLKFTVLRLSLVPWCIEAGAAAILSRYVLDISWKFAALLGVIIAAVAPAVIVPCLFRLRAKSYGVAKGIPTLIIAVASIGDSTSVAVFGIMKSIMFSEPSVTSVLLQGPVSILGGIGFGVLWGLVCSYAPERNDPFVAPLRILLLLAGGMAAVFGSELLGYGGAGPLGCVASAFVALCFWTKQGWDVEDNPAATSFEIFWMIFQPILFGVTGARVRINELEGSVVCLAVAVLVAGVVIRILGTVLISTGCGLNLKEKVFVSICWMCKAMVQVRH